MTIIQNKGRTSNAEIARQVGMAPSGVLERIRKLEKRGIILGYEAVVAPKELGKSLTAFTSVNVEEGVGSIETGEQFSKMPEVLEVHYTAGRDSYLVKVRVEDTEALQRLLVKFGSIPNVRDTHTTIVLTTVKETRALALEDGNNQKPGEK